jgi:hypothetical protein
MSEGPDADELSAFVTSTLGAIAAGIEGAQGTLMKSPHGTGVSGYSAPAQVEFDIAVSAKKSGNTDAGLKVAVFGIGANIGGGEGTESSSVSRIRFTVPTKFKTTTPISGVQGTDSAWNRND